jgi:hypothetical protein
LTWASLCSRARPCPKKKKKKKKKKTQKVTASNWGGGAGASRETEYPKEKKETLQRYWRGEKKVSGSEINSIRLANLKCRGQRKGSIEMRKPRVG